MKCPILRLEPINSVYCLTWFNEKHFGQSKKRTVLRRHASVEVVVIAFRGDKIVSGRNILCKTL